MKLRIMCAALLAMTVLGCGGRETIVPKSDDIEQYLTPPAGKSLLVIVKPAAYFHEKVKSVKVNGEKLKIDKKEPLLIVPVEPGAVTITPPKRYGTPESVRIEPGGRHYLVDRNHAASVGAMGDLYYELGAEDSALVWYRKALSLNPSLTGFEHRYGEVIVGRGSSTEILEALKRAVKSNRATADNYYQLGRIYLLRKDYKEAQPLLKKAVIKATEHVEAQTALARAYYHLGKDKLGIAHATKAIEADPKTILAYKVIGDFYARQEKNEQSLNAYRRFLDNGGKMSYVAQKVGTHLYENKEYEDAARYLAMTTGERGKDFKHQLRLAESEFYSGQYEKVIPRFKSLIARGPKREIRKDIMKKLAQSYTEIDEPKKAIYWVERYSKLSKEKDPEVAYLRGLHNEQLNPKKAIRTYRSNIIEFPEDYRNYLRLGMMLANDKSSAAESLKMMNKAKALAGDRPEALLEIARVYGKLGQTGKELTAYRRYVESDPENVEANLRIGTILAERNRLTEGIGYIETAHEIAPENVRVMLALADAYRRRGDNGKSIDLLEQAKELRPYEARIRRRLYEAYRRTGKSGKEMEELRALLKIEPDPALQLRYARMAFDTKEYAEAQNAVEDLLAVNPENIEAVMLWGKILRVQKKYDQAIEAFKEVDYIQSGYAPALYEQAETYLLMSKPHWAEKFYERALRADPNYARAYLGYAKVARMRKNKEKYRLNIMRAYRIDPEDSEVKAAYESLRR